MDGMSSDDTEIAKKTLAKEYKAHVDGLKFEGLGAGAGASFTPGMPGSGGQRPAMVEARSSLDSLEVRCATCLSEVKASKSHTREIIALMQQLGADIESKDSPRKTQTKKSGADKMKERKQNLNDQQMKSDHGMDDGDLEERTGYSTVVTNRATAAASRAIS